MMIAILVAMEIYDAHKKVSIKALVRSLRKDQSGAIENAEQYRLIYKVIKYFVQDKIISNV